MRLHRTECTGMKRKLPVETVAVCDIWCLARERRAAQVKEVFNRVFVSVVCGAGQRALGVRAKLPSPFIAADGMELVGLDVRPRRIHESVLNVNTDDALQDDPGAADLDRLVLAALECGMCLGQLCRPRAQRRLQCRSCGCFLRMLVRVMPGPSGNEAESSQLLPLAQTFREVVFPVLATADHQATSVAAVGRRSDDDIGDSVILPAGHRQEVVPPLQFPQGRVRFLPVDFPTVERIAEVAHVHPAASPPLIRTKLRKFPNLADNETRLRVHRLPPLRPDMQHPRQPTG